MRFLIVDDIFISRRILVKELSKYGECMIGVDGAEAIEAVEMALDENKPYDMIFLDIMMPGIDGLEALKKIRQMEKERGIKSSKESKIIMATALGDPKTMFNAYYEGGATGYMVKPFSIKVIRETLRENGINISKEE